MFLSFWLRSLSVMDFHITRIRRPRCYTTRRKRPRRVWIIEALEDRTLLSTISVTSNLDTVDASDGVTTLREAILAANAEPGHDTIVFNIDGDGVHTIQPLSALPQILDSVTIDGSTQNGYAGTPLIELDGSLAGLSTNGLHIFAGNTTIRGLAINRFGRDGIYLQNGDGNTIVGNFIGTDASGTVAMGNGVQGLRIVDSADNMIGGTTAWDRNVISANRANGIALIGAYSTGNVIQGNYIGTDVTGTVDLGNRLNGVIVGASDSNTLIGGTADGAGNVISGNGWSGVSFVSLTSNSVVEGNFIGTDASGLSALGNDLHGVYLFDGSRMNRIGGDTAAAGNVIAFNGGNGLTVTATNTFGNTIRANSIHSNGGLGIDLGNDGVTLNDDADADGGPNVFQNYPTLTSATENTLETYVTGSFDGAANVSLALDFYANATDGSAQIWLGSTVVTTDDFGHALIDVSLSVVANGGDLITATATEAGGSTSEFSFGVTVTSVDPPAPEPDPAPSPVPEPVLSVEEHISQTLGSINEFVSTGVLDQRAGKAVSATLNNAMKQLKKGNTNSAANMLEASANKVQALVRSGRLAAGDGQALLDQLKSVVDQLQNKSSGEFSTLDGVFSGNKIGKILHRV